MLLPRLLERASDTCRGATRHSASPQPEIRDVGRVRRVEQPLFDSLCDRIRLGTDPGVLKTMLGHIVGDDLTRAQFDTLLAIPGFQYIGGLTGEPT